MPFLNIRSIATVIAGACLFAHGQVTATTLTTTSTATWETSTFTTGGHSETNFYPVSSMFYNTAAGISLSAPGSTGSIVITGVDNSSYYLAGSSSSKTLQSAMDSGAYIDVALPTGGESALLIGTASSAGRPETLPLSDGETFSVSSNVFGVSVSHPISWFTLSAPVGSQALVSDVWYAASALPQDAPGGSTPTPAPTPEPATILMTCAGGLLLGGASRKRHAGTQAIS